MTCKNWGKGWIGNFPQWQLYIKSLRLTFICTTKLFLAQYNTCQTSEILGFFFLVSHVALPSSFLPLLDIWVFCTRKKLCHFTEEIMCPMLFIFFLTQQELHTLRWRDSCKYRDSNKSCALCCALSMFTQPSSTSSFEHKYNEHMERKCVQNTLFKNLKLFLYLASIVMNIYSYFHELGQ